MDRFDTVFSNSENPEEAANMERKTSGAIEEHAYWGSMRDRLAAAQDNELKFNRLSSANGSADGSPIYDNASKRVRVPSNSNLCVIRSGQDWPDTLLEERKLYLDTMYPVLIEGMDFCAMKVTRLDAMR